jgi:hypothetical protein
MSRIFFITAVFVVVSVHSTVFRGHESTSQQVSPSPATPHFALRVERLGWTRVPVKLCVMDIPWGVALRAPVQGPMKRHTRWQRRF